jgi:diguanylate cyclase
MTATGDSGLEKAKITALAAIEGLAKIGLPPSPVNFSVWYTHLVGENPSLSRRISQQLEAKKPLSPDVMDDLWRRFCSPNSDPNAVMKASDQLGRIIAEVVQQMNAVGADTKRFGGAIETFSSGIAAALNSDDVEGAMRQVTQTMLLETRHMAEQNGSLEGKLKAASIEMTTLRAELIAMKREAFTDALTGIGNRKTFDQSLKEAMAAVTPDGPPLCLVMVDIDHFKKFNDTHGHLLGDEVLKLVAKCLVSGVKGRDTVARYGGEEFGVILPETSVENACRVADKLRELVKSKHITIKSTGKNLGVVTMSLGAALYRHGESADSLVKRADAALYYAKRHGRDRVADERDVPEMIVGAAD